MVCDDLQRLIRAMRFHLPAGFYLLFLPCLWGLLLTRDKLCVSEILLFMTGAVWAVSLGCLYNDWIDRSIDAKVERTQRRPFVEGNFSPFMTLMTGVLFIGPALFFLKMFPWQISGIAFVAWLGVLLYPFLKRWVWWPQIFLGLIYNLGIFMAAWPLWNGHVLLTYIFGVLWIVECDTIYGYQDYEEDRRIGVKSLPVYLGYTKGQHMLAWMPALRYGLLSFVGKGWLPELTCIGLACYAQRRIQKLHIRSPDSCYQAFIRAPYEGLLVTGWLLMIWFCHGF